MPSTKVFVLLSLLTLAVFTIPLQHDIKETFDRLRSESNGQLNQRPIIGVLAQPSTQPNYPPEQYNFIAASYIKFVESAGARAVPIQWDMPQADLAKLMNQVNGLLLPGGSNDATDEQGHWTPYFYVNKFLVEQAEKMNRNGVYFPIWATCQGYQYLSQIYANDSTVLGKDFNDLNINHNQTFTSIAKTSRLYSGLSDWMRTHMETEPAVNYYHNYGVEPKVFQSNSNLMNSFNVLSTSKTATGREFIAAFEHKMFPFYGVQFHPEKSIYEWLESNGATHTPEAIAVTQYMENFFNLEARKNLNKFESAKEEYDALIYNFQTVQTNVAYVQSYFFKTHNSTTGIATRGGWVSDI